MKKRHLLHLCVIFLQRRRPKALLDGNTPVMQGYWSIVLVRAISSDSTRRRSTGLMDKLCLCIQGIIGDSLVFK